MENPVFKIKILAQSELSLVKIHVQRHITKIALYAIALAFFLLAIAFLNFALYNFLLKDYNPEKAALFIALLNFLLGSGLVLFIPKMTTPNKEQQMIMKLRDTAYEDLNKDIDNIRQETQKLADKTNQIYSNVSNVTSLTKTLLRKNET